MDQDWIIIVPRFVKEKDNWNQKEFERRFKLQNAFRILSLR